MEIKINTSDCVFENGNSDTCFVHVKSIVVKNKLFIKTLIGNCFNTFQVKMTNLQLAIRNKLNYMYDVQVNYKEATVMTLAYYFGTF